MSAALVALPWFVNDRGQQVYTVRRGSLPVGWYGPHPCGFYGSRNAWPCGMIESTKPTEAAIIEWIGGATSNPTKVRAAADADPATWEGGA